MAKRRKSLGNYLNKKKRDRSQNDNKSRSGKSRLVGEGKAQFRDNEGNVRIINFGEFRRNSRGEFADKPGQSDNKINPPDKETIEKDQAIDFDKLGKTISEGAQGENNSGRAQRGDTPGREERSPGRVKPADERVTRMDQAEIRRKLERLKVNNDWVQKFLVQKRKADQSEMEEVLTLAMESVTSGKDASAYMDEIIKSGDDTILYDLKQRYLKDLASSLGVDADTVKAKVGDLRKKETWVEALKNYRDLSSGKTRDVRPREIPGDPIYQDDPRYGGLINKKKYKLREEAEQLGITREIASEFGNLARKSTWVDAILYYRDQKDKEQIEQPEQPPRQQPEQPPREQPEQPPREQPEQPPREQPEQPPREQPEQPGRAMDILKLQKEVDKLEFGDDSKVLEEIESLKATLQEDLENELIRGTTENVERIKEQISQLELQEEIAKTRIQPVQEIREGRMSESRLSYLNTKELRKIRDGLGLTNADLKSLTGGNMSRKRDFVNALIAYQESLKQPEQPPRDQPEQPPKQEPEQPPKQEPSRQDKIINYLRIKDQINRENSDLAEEVNLYLDDLFIGSQKTPPTEEATTQLREELLGLTNGLVSGETTPLARRILETKDSALITQVIQNLFDRVSSAEQWIDRSGLSRQDKIISNLRVRNRIKPENGELADTLNAGIQEAAQNNDGKTLAEAAKYAAELIAGKDPEVPDNPLAVELAKGKEDFGLLTQTGVALGNALSKTDIPEPNLENPPKQEPEQPPKQEPEQPPKQEPEQPPKQEPSRQDKIINYLRIKDQINRENSDLAEEVRTYLDDLFVGSQKTPPTEEATTQLREELLGLTNGLVSGETTSLARRILETKDSALITQVIQNLFDRISSAEEWVDRSGLSRQDKIISNLRVGNRIKPENGELADTLNAGIQEAAQNNDGKTLAEAAKYAAELIAGKDPEVPDNPLAVELAKGKEDFGLLTQTGVALGNALSKTDIPEPNLENPPKQEPEQPPRQELTPRQDAIKNVREEMEMNYTEGSAIPGLLRDRDIEPRPDVRAQSKLQRIMNLEGSLGTQIAYLEAQRQGKLTDSKSGDYAVAEELRGQLVDEAVNDYLNYIENNQFSDVPSKKSAQQMEDETTQFKTIIESMLEMDNSPEDLADPYKRVKALREFDATFQKMVKDYQQSGKFNPFQATDTTSHPFSSLTGIQGFNELKTQMYFDSLRRLKPQQKAALKKKNPYIVFNRGDYKEYEKVGDKLFTDVFGGNDSMAVYERLKQRKEENLPDSEKEILNKSRKERDKLEEEKSEVLNELAKTPRSDVLKRKLSRIDKKLQREEDRIARRTTVRNPDVLEGVLDLVSKNMPQSKAEKRFNISEEVYDDRDKLESNLEQFNNITRFNERDLYLRNIYDEAPDSDPDNTRAFASQGRGLIQAGYEDKIERTAFDVLHEMTHFLEYANPQLKEAALAWIDSRKNPPDQENPSPMPGYDKSEVGWKGNYPDPYVAKYYGGRATEVYTTMWNILREKGEDALFNDLSYLKFVLGGLVAN